MAESAVVTTRRTTPGNWVRRGGLTTLAFALPMIQYSYIPGHKVLSGQLRVDFSSVALFRQDATRSPGGSRSNHIPYQALSTGTDRFNSGAVTRINVDLVSREGIVGKYYASAGVEWSSPLQMNLHGTIGRHKLSRYRSVHY